jgi:hypothetical protein
MTPSTIDPIGNYCGRFDASWLGEPLNSFSNVAFVIAAAIALRAWQRGRAEDRDPAALALIILAAAIGAGSFVFHSHPTHETLPIDLIPIQIFGLAYAAYVVRRMFGASWPVTIATTAAFGLATARWQRALRGVLGGAAGHGLSAAAIAIAGAMLSRRGDPRGRHLLAAACSYAIALGFRAIDLPICTSFPLGVHWVWHVVQGVTVGLLLSAAV